MELVIKKLSSNPVVDGKIMPEDCSRADFRDPKVWKDEDGRYYMLAGNRTYDGIPQVVLFSSDDMYSWKFESVFAKDETGRFGAVWECPDYFEMDGYKVLIVSHRTCQQMESFTMEITWYSSQAMWMKRNHIFQV